MSLAGRLSRSTYREAHGEMLDQMRGGNCVLCCWDAAMPSALVCSREGLLR